LSEIIYQSRKEAKENGGRRYHGRPCKLCGKTERQISGHCVCKEYKASEKVRNQTPECKAYHKAYWQSPKGKIKLSVNQQKTRSKRRGAEGNHTTEEWLALKEQFGNICLRCKRHESELDRVLEQDHVIPLTKGGSNWITNIQPLCHDCNGMGGKGIEIIDYRS
jgi:5-methylcytosine-specific restriction endonuclease McrA